ncbi:MAG: 4Fe-4S binding protein [Nanoarchaeota archaeon]
MPKPVIDKDKCTDCGSCIEACPVDVFAKKANDVKVVKADDCIGCQACAAVCPDKAIIVED